MSKHTRIHTEINYTPKTKISVHTTVQITLFWRTKYMRKHIPFFGGRESRRGSFQKEVHHGGEGRKEEGEVMEE